ncbi:hypothetical protein VC83_00113 [Pseudogymnoascus destructans]|uniref:Uncharacterized protein n=2 Tax=Pseudogymnoascus destructans TaxID=655981 RepID=L8GDG8_PSED2|nr:uncharacterized protein VC83_00113 [Pseudogymnoascus destructans]ELR10763.1 hypothetical protein GMDG_05018 [Pseudogymnoascus destructans 20631-21]OAF63008.1 hypothetical protein VC83_00113 [Pseudogymnoascus destructans]
MEVSQKKKVTIVRLSVLNSHDAWREIKQIDKNIIDILTKLHSPESFQAIADALNNMRDEVVAAHLSPMGQILLAGKEILPLQLHRSSFVPVLEDVNLITPDPTIGDSTTEDWTSDEDKPGPSFTPVNRPLLKRKRAMLAKTVRSSWKRGHGRSPE